MSGTFSQIATDMISSLGYGGLAIGLIVDSAGVPIPSEVLLPLAGALASQGRMDLTTVIIVGTLAQTAGAILAYWLGMGPGLGLVKKYGKYVLFSEHELQKTQSLFEKWGSWLTLFGRCLPGVRTYIGFPAGIARMPFIRFATASFIGSLVWTVFLSVLGYKLADRLSTIDSFLSKFGYAFVIVAGIAFGWYVHHKLRGKGSKRYKQKAPKA